MTRVVFDSPELDGNCIFGDPLEIAFPPLLSDVCIFDASSHPNGGCIFDNDLLLTTGTRPYRKGWGRKDERIIRDDEDILVILMCSTKVLH